MKKTMVTATATKIHVITERCAQEAHFLSTNRSSEMAGRVFKFTLNEIDMRG
jgi:hypothetical protein